jgi:prepilin-type processing-associated H-X9-DG protein
MGVQHGSVNQHVGPMVYDANNRFSIMFRNSRTRMTDVTDGTSTTIMVVECGGRPQVWWAGRVQPAAANDQGIGWADSEGPFSFDGAAADGSAENCPTCTSTMNKRNNNEPYSFHSGGGNFLFGDGHVQFVRDSVDIRTFSALLTKSAGEVVGGDY